MFTPSPKSPKKGARAPFRLSLPEFTFIQDLKDNFNEHGLLPTKNVRKVAWIFGLVFIYIFFQHNIETLIVRMEKAQVRMKEMRAAYITQKAGYMFESKHSEISKKLESVGMDKNLEPPIKIVVKD